MSVRSGCIVRMLVSSFAKTPVSNGCRPLKTAAREGLQSGAAQWALEKRMPRLARRSMLGDFAWGWPPRQPIQSLRSSIAMKSTLGGAASALAAHETHNSSAVIGHRQKLFFRSLMRISDFIHPGNQTLAMILNLCCKLRVVDQIVQFERIGLQIKKTF